MTILVRKERPEDHRPVEELTRNAFWNLHGPGCDEHYLAHTLRTHPDIVADLDLVLEVDGRLVGSIFYTRAALRGPGSAVHPVLTFGPVSIAPELQRQGWGARLIRESFDRAADLGFGSVVIFGNPGHYVGLGFRSCIRFGISLADGSFPTALLVKELAPGSLPPGPWVYEESPAYDLDSEAAATFDRGFPTKERLELPRHEEFFILSRSRIRPSSSSD